jgi:hypothetical protein
MGAAFTFVYMVILSLIICGVYSILPEKYQKKILEWIDGED